jgi:hypothetical protein
VRHSRPAKQRVWLGPDRYISGCDRRITHANSDSHSNGDGDGHSNGNGHSNSDGHSHCDGHGNRYIDAQREPNSYTETYTYSQSSSNRSASAHTAASNVAIFTRATFLHSATGDERSVPIDFIPVRVHAAISCCGAVYEHPRPAWRSLEEKSK